MLKLGIVGCGGIASGHVGQLKDTLESGVVTALVDIDISRAEAAAEYFPGAVALTDYRDMLANVDAVLLSLPHHLHYEIGIECLRAGKHVLMEKPLANTEQQSLELIEEAEKRGLTLMTAYVMRFHPLTIKLKELIDAKTYGDVFSLSIWTEQFTDMGPDSWAASAQKLGGGQLFSHGCHYIDLMLLFLGDPVEGIHIGTNYGTPWMEKEGTSNAVMKFESGALGYHFGTWGAKGTRLGYAYHAHCTEGMLEVNIMKGTLTLIQGEEETVLMSGEDQGKYLAAETVYFLNCIKTGEKPITDARSSLQSLRVIWKMYEAEQAGKIADLRGLGFPKD